jgi:hypothetical protein
MKINDYSNFKKVIQFHNDEEGSLSLLIIGLFVAALTALMIVTDIGVVANAKRTFRSGN